MMSTFRPLFLPVLFALACAPALSRAEEPVQKQETQKQETQIPAPQESILAPNDGQEPLLPLAQEPLSPEARDAAIGGQIEGREAAQAAATIAPAAGDQQASGEAASGNEDEALAVTDTDETAPLPEYPMGARIATGEMTTYTVNEEDTFLDIARHFGLGYIELRAANPDIDPWAPTPGDQLVIPTFNLLPRARQEGIVVNLGDMRMYYFKNPGKPPLSYALGVGREGLATPTGVTTIIRKAAGPSWFPTERMRKEKPYLPAAIPPGPSNPLGTHALYLGWPTFLIHGSNKPWGIGRRVSSGCMRMYPEDVVALFGMAGVGTKVTVVDQPILVGWLDDGLYLEANPSKTQGNQIEIDGTHEVKPLTAEMRKVIAEAAGPGAADRIDWDAVEQAYRERRGYPVLIAKPSPAEPVRVEKQGRSSERGGEKEAKTNFN